ncbi:MAG: lactonase family protein [Herpetosiphonaceae bacterium]|nr:lactonase family protein [Herpetosiphonaceae bacterium]
MSSSQQHLIFVGRYATVDQPGILAFDFDETSGTLAPCGSAAGVVNPSFLTVHPNGRWLYTTSETNQAQGGISGGVWALRFERDAAAVTITPLNHRSSNGDDPCHVLLDERGQWLVTTNYTSGSVAVFPVLTDGSLGEMSDFDQHDGSSVVAGRQEGPHAHSATWTPDNQRIIVADLGTDQLFVYDFDHSGGKLGTPVRTATRPGSGPRHMVFHPNRRLVYVANELDSTVSVYDYDAASARLREQQFVPTIPSGTGESLVADIHLSPAGERLYVSNRGHNSIAVFDVGEDGQLTGVATPSCGGNWPRNFAVSPDDRFILVSNQYSGDLAVLPVDGGAEALGEPVGHAAVPQAACILFVHAHE